MDRLFLDANVLFSAAYRKDAGVRELWGLLETELVTSGYAVEEARRNLNSAGQRSELEELLKTVRISNLLTDPAEHPEIAGLELPEKDLPEKDLPILRAAAASGCTHLITGDRKHFGCFFGKKAAGILIVRPADYLADRRP